MADNLDLNMNIKAVDEASPQLTLIQSLIDKLATAWTGQSAAQRAAAAATQATNDALRVQAEAAKKAAEEIDGASESAGGLAGASNGVKRELLVLAHEMSQGNFTRFGGSLLVLGERMGNISALFNPWVLGIGAATAGLVAMSISAEHTARSLNQIEAGFTATGNAGLFTDKEIGKLVDSFDKLSGITKAIAFDTFKSFSHEAGLTGDQIKKLVLLSDDYAIAFGMKVPEAAKKLAEALKDPVKGAESLDKQMNLLTTDQMESIRQFVRLGETAQAQAVIMKALEDRLGGIHDKVTPLEGSITRVKNAWQSLTDSATDNKPWVGFAFVIDKVSGAIEKMTKITNDYKASAMGQWMMKHLDPTNSAIKTPEQTGQASSGLIGGGSGQNILAAKTAADDAARKADELQIKRTLEMNAGYMSQARRIEETKEKIEGLNKILNDPVATAGQKKLAREEIDGLNEMLAKHEKLNSQIVAQQLHNLEVNKQLLGDNEKMSQSEKILFDIQEGRFKNASAGQIAELKLLAEKGLALDKELEQLKKTQAAMKALAGLQEAAFLSTDKKSKSQASTIDEEVNKATGGNQTPQVQQYADFTRNILTQEQVKKNDVEIDKIKTKLNETLTKQLDTIDKTNNQYIMNTNQLRVYNEELKVREAWENKIAELSPGLINYEEEKRKLIEGETEALAKLNAKQAERVAFESDWVNGARKALNEFQSTADNTAAITYGAMKSGFGAISTFFEDVMQTGGFNFKKLGDSFKKTIDKMVADALAAQLMKSLFGSFGQTGQMGGLVGSAASAIFGGFREGGGDVSPGQSYIVGEKRPEIFVPNTSGKIIPNTGGMGMSSNTTVNMTVQAIDSQSFMGAIEKHSREIVKTMNNTQRNYNLG